MRPIYIHFEQPLHSLELFECHFHLRLGLARGFSCRISHQNSVWISLIPHSWQLSCMYLPPWFLYIVPSSGSRKNIIVKRPLNAEVFHSIFAKKCYFVSWIRWFSNVQQLFILPHQIHAWCNVSNKAISFQCSRFIQKFEQNLYLCKDHRHHSLC